MAEDNKAKDKGANAPISEDNRPTFAHKGREYAFRAKAPATIAIDGKAMEQKQILKDKVLMAELIEGNNFFVDRIKTKN